jgi:hypothetical protein
MSKDAVAKAVKDKEKEKMLKGADAAKAVGTEVAAGAAVEELGGEDSAAGGAASAALTAAKATKGNPYAIAAGAVIGGVMGAAKANAAAANHNAKLKAQEKQRKAEIAENLGSKHRSTLESLKGKLSGTLRR